MNPPALRTRERVMIVPEGARDGFGSPWPGRAVVWFPEDREHAVAGFSDDEITCSDLFPMARWANRTAGMNGVVVQ
jgi:hypothetical protein